MKRLLLACLVLALCACDPCASISAEEACERVALAVEKACGTANACTSLYKTSMPLARCNTDDRSCVDHVDQLIQKLAGAKDCDSVLKQTSINCFPE